MNQYTMPQLPGGIECYGQQDLYAKSIDVGAWVLKADSAQLLAAIDDSPVVTLTVPATAEFAKVTNNGANTIWYSTSGTAPVASTKSGVQLANGASIIVYGEAMAALKMVTAASESATAYVQYFSS